MSTTQHAWYRSRDRVSPNERRVAGVQAAFYVGTGVWPIVHRRSFERVTGPKTDFWLARTVGLNVAAVRGRISKTYLADAAAELMLVGAWLSARDRPNEGFPQPPAGESRVPPC